jgi:hypothetical protein
MDAASELANCLLYGVCVRRRAYVCSRGHYLVETCKQASSHTIDHDMGWSECGGGTLCDIMGATTVDSAVSTGTGRTDTSYFS